MTTKPYRVKESEFIALIALISALNALAIDVMLPAMGTMREAFGLAPDSTQVSLIISVFLVGLGLGQYLFGPVTDALGRKRVLYGGIVLYLAGAAGTILAPTLPAMITFRFLWGLGAGAPRVVSRAIVRDRYHGDDMSRVLAVVTGVFMIVPAVAPAIGQLVLSFGSWRYPFAFAALVAGGVGLWSIRLRETLPHDRRITLSLRNTFTSTREVLRHGTFTRMTVAMTFGMAAFYPYLGASQLMYEEIYGRAEQFAYWFGLAAVFMAGASVVVSRAIRRVGSDRVLTIILVVFMATATIFVAISLATTGHPSFAIYYTLTTLLVIVIVVSRAVLTSAAMEDVGHLAGTASALIGTITLVGGGLLGAAAAAVISSSTTPFAANFLVFGGLMTGFVVWDRRSV